MNKRTLTLLVEFDQDDKPDWIWLSHMLNKPIHKVHILAIGEGDQFKDIEDEEEDDV